MPSTANTTWARHLLHTRTLGHVVVAATIGQVRYARQCAKNEMITLTNKNQDTHSKTYLSYHQLAKVSGVGKTNTTTKQLEQSYRQPIKKMEPKVASSEKGKSICPTCRLLMLGLPRHATGKGHIRTWPARTLFFGNQPQ